jgi:hypothetical protein
MSLEAPPVESCLRRAALVVVSMLIAAVPALAQTGPCPPTCANPSTPVYAYVQLMSHPNGNFYDLDAPFFLDQAYSDLNGSSRGIADLATGTLRAGAASYGLSGPSVIVGGVDVFTIGGATAGTQVAVTANLVATGTGLIESPFASMGSMIQLGFPGGANNFSRFVFQAPGNVPLNTLFPILHTAAFSFIATVGSPFTLNYFLRLDSGNGGGNALDFMNSAHLSFTLPVGANVTSVAGFSAGVSAVPEPSTLVLVVGGIALLVGAQRRRRVAMR